MFAAVKSSGAPVPIEILPFTVFCAILSSEIVPVPVIVPPVNPVPVATLVTVPPLFPLSVGLLFVNVILSPLRAILRPVPASSTISSVVLPSCPEPESLIFSSSVLSPSTHDIAYWFCVFVSVSETVFVNVILSPLREILRPVPASL